MTVLGYRVMAAIRQTKRVSGRPAALRLCGHTKPYPLWFIPASEPGSSNRQRCELWVATVGMVEMPRHPSSDRFAATFSLKGRRVEVRRCVGDAFTSPPKGEVKNAVGR